MDELISNDNGVRSALNALDEITAEEYGLALAEVSVGVQELPSEIQTAAGVCTSEHTARHSHERVCSLDQGTSGQSCRGRR